MAHGEVPRDVPPQDLADGRESQRLELIEAAAAVASTLLRRLLTSRRCQSVLPLVEAYPLGVDERLRRGDRYAVYDAMAEVCEALAEIMPALAAVLVDDPELLARWRELERLKPAYGTRPIIEGGRQAGEQVNKETAGTDASRKDCRRIGRCDGERPQATAGKRAGGNGQC